MSSDTNSPPPLTSAEKDKVVQHLRSKAPSLVCPVCKNNNFSVGDHLVSAATMATNGDTFLGGASYPMALVICNNCYHPIPLMANPLGLLTPPKKEGANG